MADQYIYTIENLTKAYGKREVLKNIWLAFYPGAKIGVIGGNGAGKSTLLRVMAAVETDFLGAPRLTPGFTVRWGPQQPRPAGSTAAVSHDRYFLDNVAQWILELDRGHGIPWKGNYSSWLEQKQARLAKEEKQESARRKAVARELEWAKLAPRARVAKSKARLNQYEKLAAQEVSDKQDELVMQIPPGPHLGDLVGRAEGVRKGYGDNL